MAPASADPRQILVTLNVARRKALYELATEVTAFMRSQLELQPASPAPPGDPQPALPPRRSPANTPPATGAGDLDVRLLPRNGEGGAASINLEDRDGGAKAERREERQAAARKPPPRPPQALVALRKAALRHFDSWRAEALGKLREIVSQPDDQKVLDARRKRAEQLAQKRAQEPREGEDLINFGGDGGAMTGGQDSGTAENVSKKTVANMQSLYHPIPTRLATIPLDDRKEILSSILLMLLSMGNYSAYSRTMVCYLASALEISPQFLDHEEVEIAVTMMEAVQQADAEKKKQQKGGSSSSSMSAEAEAQKRAEAGRIGRYWKVGLASVAGAAIIGVTGGLAAPLVAGTIGGLMGSVGLGGLASFLGVFWMNGALVGTLFGAFGAKMTGEIIDQYAREVEDFRFLPLRSEWGDHSTRPGGGGGKGKGKGQGENEARRLRVTIGINGWLKEEADVTRCWRPLGDESEVFALRYELKTLLALGVSLQQLVTSYAWKAIKVEILKRTVLATLWGALWPIQLVMMASKVDNPFSLARNRSEKAGKILADALINKVQGERPVTLVGYSLGARVIYCCLRELADRKAFGLIDSVVLIGAPVPSNPGHWQMMKTVVSGKLFNVYSENDFILAFLYRATSAQLGIAGLQPISEEIEGIENLDLSEEVMGHLRYPDLIAKILSRCGFNNVIGGEGAIEKDSIDIQLRNDDYPESGNLIDVGEPGAKQLQPTRHTLEEMDNEKFDPSVKNVMEQKSNISVRDEKIRGEKVPGDHKLQTPSPLPEASDPLTTGGFGSSQDPSPRNGSRQGSHDSPPPSYTHRSVEEPIRQPYAPPRGAGQTTFTHPHDVEDSDEEEWGGIQMQDNDDGDMVTVEPLSIHDQEKQ